MKTHSAHSPGAIKKKKLLQGLWKFSLFAAIFLILFIIYWWLPAPVVSGADESIIHQQSLESPVVIEFNQAMNQKSVEEAFRTQPNLKGSFEWSNKQTLHFKPKKALAIEDELRVTIDQSAKNWYGKKLAQTSRLNFIMTGPPSVIFASSYPPSLSEVDVTEIPLLVVGNDESLTVMFDRPMNWQSVDRNELIVLDPPLEGAISFLGSSALSFKPNSWPVDQIFTATLPATIQDTSGGEMAKAFSWSFRTPHLQVTSSNLTAPLLPTDPIVIQFNRKVDLNQIRPGDNMLLFPSNDLEKTGLEDNGFFNAEITHDLDEEGRLKKDTLIFKPTFPFQSNVEHRFVITEGFDGLEIPFEASFFVAPETSEDPDPSNIAGNEWFFDWKNDVDWPLYLSDASFTFPFESNGIESVSLSLCRLTEMDLIRILQAKEERIYDCQESKIEAALSKNKDTFDLRNIFEQEWLSGMYMLTAAISSEEDVQLIDQGFFISDTLLLLKRSPGGVFVWSVDAKTLEPVPRMEVSLLDATGEVLAKGITDGNGIYKITRPIPETLYVLGSKQTNDENRLAFVSPALVDLPTSNGDDSTVYLTASSTLLTDSNRVWIKGIWRFFEQSAWLLPSHPFVTLTLENIQGVVIERVEVTVRPNGSFDHEWWLPEDLEAGEYQVSAYLGENRIDSNALLIEVDPSKSDVALDWLAAEPFYFEGRIPILTLKGFYPGQMPASQLSGSWTLYELDGNRPVLVDRQPFSLGDNGLTQVPLEGVSEKRGAYKIVATLNDSNHLPTSIEHDFRIQTGQYQSQLEVRHRFLESGDPLGVRVNHLNTNDQSLYDFETVFTLTDIASGQKVWKNDKTFSEDDHYFFDFEIPSSLAMGPYLLTATSRDSQGHEIVGEEMVYLLSEEDPVPLYDDLRLLAGQETFLLGGKADLILNVPRASSESPVPALITYERDRVLASEYVLLEAPVTRLEMPIRSAMVPYVQVIAHLPTTLDDGTLTFEEAILNLSTKAPENDLLIDVMISPEHPQPGDEVTISFKVHDFQDLPVASALTINVNDRQDTYPTAIDHFFFPRSGPTISLSNAHAFNLNKENQVTLIHESEQLADPWRSAWFQPFLETDFNGDAEITFTMPQMEADWFLQVTATSDKKRFGSFSAPLLQKESLDITPLLPEFVTLGDEVIFTTQINNAGSEKVVSQVTFESPYVDLRVDSKQTFSLEPKKKTTLSWKGRVTDFDDSRHLPVSFVMDDQRAEERIPVRSHLALQTLYKGELTSESNQGTFNAPDMKLGVFGGINLVLGDAPGSMSGEALFASSHFVQPGLDSLIANLLGSLLLSSHDPLSQTLQQSIDQLSMHQAQDGGLTRWKRGHVSHLRSTTYGLLTLEWLREQGYTVPSEQVDALRRFIETQLFSSQLNSNETLLSIWVLAELGVYDTEFTLELFQQRASFSPSEKALLLLTLNELFQAGQSSLSPFVDDLMADIVSMGIEEANHLYFKKQGKETVKMTATVLHAFHKVDPNNGLNDKMLRFLASEMSSLTHPVDSEALLWLLLAFSEAGGHASSGASFSLELNGKPVSENAFVEMQQESMEEEYEWKASDVEDGYVSMQWLYAQDAPSLMPVEDQSLIVRQYRDLESGDVVDQMKVGRWYEGELLFILPSSKKDVLIQSPLPSGVWPLHFSSPLFGGFASESSLVRGAWQFDHASMEQGQITLYSSLLPAGVYHVRYLVQAGLEGEFQHLPASLQALYQQGTYARTTGEILRIVP